MPDFQFLRQTPPDVMRYLPQFLKKDEHFAKIQEALSMEHEKQRQAIIDIAKQFFVDTATWGLSSWERVYATNPPADADITLRRALIKAKMAGKGIMTKQAVERLVNLFTENNDAYIQEDTAAGAFDIIFPSVIKYHKELKEALEEMVPAHLLFFGRYKRRLQEERYIGIAPKQHKKIHIGLNRISDTSVTNTMYFGAGVRQHKKIHIKIATMTDTAIRQTKYVGSAVRQHKKIRIRLSKGD